VHAKASLIRPAANRNAWLSTDLVSARARSASARKSAIRLSRADESSVPPASLICEFAFLGLQGVQDDLALGADAIGQERGRLARGFRRTAQAIGAEQRVGDLLLTEHLVGEQFNLPTHQDRHVLRRIKGTFDEQPRPGHLADGGVEAGRRVEPQQTEHTAGRWRFPPGLAEGGRRMLRTPKERGTGLGIVRVPLLDGPRDLRCELAVARFHEGGF
jgi:hypothetical protein